MFKHFPITKVDMVIDHYSKKDNTPITYVCTTELHRTDVPVDIFYRDTPHPEFGNRYFGIFENKGETYICNADNIEKMCFGMVEDDENNLQYSQYRHDYKSFKNGNSIDGGRAYIKSSANVSYYYVKNGEFVGGNLTSY